MDSNASAKLDDAVQQGLRTTSFRIGGQRYSFDLDAKIQTNESSRVRRPISSQGPSGHPSPALPSSTSPDSNLPPATAAHPTVAAPSTLTTPSPLSGTPTTAVDPQATPATSATQPNATAATQASGDKLKFLKDSAARQRAMLTWDANGQVSPRRYVALVKKSFAKQLDRLSVAYASDIRYRAAKEIALRNELKQTRLALESAKRSRRRHN
jgi:hypothetical protein